MAQWSAHWTSNPEVAGSNPVGSATHRQTDKTAWRNWIACWTPDPVVAGSSPVAVASPTTTTTTTEHDWRSRQRVGLIILRSWVRSPHRALTTQHNTLHWRSRQRIGLMCQRSRVRAPDGARGLLAQPGRARACTQPRVCTTNQLTFTLPVTKYQHDVCYSRLF